jgi:phage terminase large subunit-like protein
MDSAEVHPTTQYALDVVAGRIIAGPYVRASCKRHLHDLEHAHLRGLYFDEERANHAINFFPTVLRLNGGQFEGIPFELHISQKFIVGSLFGWIREDGTRRFRVVYIEQGKGNGKSPLVAGIGLYGLIADGEARAEVYAAATKRDQAMILFRDAVAMVDQSPALGAAIRKSGRDDKVWNLFHPRSNSFFRPISSDDGQSGPRPHIGLIDELHEHKDARVINMLSAGRKWRKQPLIVAITNSGTNRQSVCWEYRESGIQVATQMKDDDTFFSYICALDEGEDPFKDISCWIKANPLLGVTLEEQYLKDEVAASIGAPTKESTTRRLNFCQWTESYSPIVNADAWNASKKEFTLDLFRGRDVYVGIDLSATTDLTAAVFVCEIDGFAHWWPEFWIPHDLVAEKTLRDKVPYDQWLRAKHIRTTPGKSIDKDFVASQIAQLRQNYGFRIVDAPYDKWRIEDLRAACARMGIDLPLSEFVQGMQSFSPAIDLFETWLLQDKIRHNGNPCLRWNAANATAYTDPAGNRKPDKSKSTGRIDGFVAGLMAHARATVNVIPKTEPGIRWVA